MKVTRREMIGGLGASLVAGCRLFADDTKVDSDRVGVCSWSYRKPLDGVAEEMGKCGIRRIHLALQPFLKKAAGDGRHGAVERESALARVQNRLRSGQWKLSAAMVGFPQEDYSTLETIRKTGGIVPDACWEKNRAIAREAAELAAELGAPALTLHAGTPDMSSLRARQVYADRVRALRDICGENGVKLLLESGQETAAELEMFLQQVSGVGVNFDPANMILYGKGNPLEAIRILAPYMGHVHIKDAVRTQVPGTWGTEVPWGEGEAGGGAFFAALASAGYDGAFAIEREGGNTRAKDIARAFERATGVAPDVEK